LIACEIDFRVGGKARYVWKNPEFEMEMRVEFLEIVEHERIVHTEDYEGWPEGHSTVTTTFVEANGQTTITVGIYYEIVRRWLGIDPKRVFALGTVFTPERKDADGASKSIRIPESMTILGRYVDDGRFIGHFSGVEAGTGRNEIRINGSAGCLRADLAKGKLWYTPTGGAEELMIIPPSARRGWRVEQDFVDSIRTGAPVKLTSFEDGLNYMRFTEAVFRSQESGGVWMDV
jgi:predicted dehydrogenase